MLVSNLKDLIAIAGSDAERYGYRWYRATGFWVTLSYRVRKLRKEGAAIYSLMIVPDILLTLLCSMICDTRLPTGATIGRGFCLPHPNGVILNDAVVIGDNVKLFQQVTLGEWGHQAPVLHDDCEIFAGAKVFGRCTLGEAVKVGANAVVNFDVAAGATVFPAASVVRPADNEYSASLEGESN